MQLPLEWVSYFAQRDRVLEVGGGVKSKLTPERADRRDAAFVHIEAGRVTKLVRDESGEPRGGFVTQAGAGRLLAHDHRRLLWRDEGAKLDLGVAHPSQTHAWAFGATTPEGSWGAYVRLEHDEKRRAAMPVTSYAFVRVTSGPSSEWSVSPWQTIDHAASPRFHLTARGPMLSAFRPPLDHAPPALLVKNLSEPEGSPIERLPLAGPGWRVRQLGDVVLDGEHWLAVAAIESEPLPRSSPGADQGSKPAVCPKAPTFPPPRPLSETRDEWRSAPPGQGGLAIASHGPEGARTLILETGLRVVPGALVRLDPARVGVSFCTEDGGGCYVAVVSLAGGEGALCSNGSWAPTPLAVDGEDLLWVQLQTKRRSYKSGSHVHELSRSSAVQGLAVRPGPTP